MAKLHINDHQHDFKSIRFAMFPILPSRLKIVCVLSIMTLCYLTVGCATLQALEPTAVFIADIKDIL